MADGPLQKVRVADLTRVWAGPLATRILGDLGAQVIKVEYRNGRGPGHVAPAAALQGLYPGGDPGDRPYNRQGSFNKLNRNKKSLVLDLQTQEGKMLFKRLAALSDVVIDNFSARVMTNLGLGYEELCQVNPEIIMVSMPGFGMTGPYRDYVALGPSIEPMTGLQSVMGYSEAEPRSTSFALPDAIAGTHGAAAVLTALWRRSETGVGAFVDLSQHEAGIGLMGEYFLGYQLDHQAPAILGNRHPWYAPQGCYRCAGEDEWVFLSIRDDPEFAKFAKILGHPEWATDPRYAKQASRWDNQQTLDTHIEAWTSLRNKQEIMRELQATGIPAGAVLNAPELLADRHLSARPFFVSLDHPEVGSIPYPGLPITTATQDFESWVAAPLLGQHNEEVLTSLLGLSESQIEELWRADIIAATPLE